MIHYQLRCAGEHAFDGWFRDSGAFEAQAARGLVACPECGEARVHRALMAPAIGRKRVVEAKAEAPAEPAAAAAQGPERAALLPDGVLAALQRIRAEIERTSDYVGADFADEARRIHHGESKQRNIYGETTPAQAEALADEGIEVARVPWVPRADS